MTHDEAVALFDRRRDAWLAEDVDAYLACWDDDMTFGSPMHRPPLHGREAYATLVHGSAAMVRPVRFDVHHLAVHGDAVLAEWTITVEHRPTGQSMEWRGMSAATYRDGRILAWREYWNPADLTPSSDRR
jgi:limonene-1,2-epoxide hydrolase